MDTIQLHFLPVGCGDAIHIRFKGEDEFFHNILIDSGYVKTYTPILKPILNGILSKGEMIDLWILTHTDNDHIGGVTKFINERDFKDKPEFVKKFWFNWSNIEILPDEGEISVKQGILLRDYFISIYKIDSQDITNTLIPIDFWGAKITILSPTLEKLNKSKTEWKNEETNLISGESDYHFTIEELLKVKFKEDDSVWNGGSIAFLFELNGKRILFLADSHPSVIVDFLKNPPFNCSKENPLKVDLVKVSHHGSCGNTSPELLELIDCENYVFCVATPNRYSFPNKKTLAWLVALRQKAKTKTNLFFNHRTPQYNDLFKMDKDAELRFNFTFQYLQNGKYSF